MTYLSMELNLTKELITGMNGRTVIILNYLICKARENENCVSVKYREIEEALNLGHTTVGYNMRFLQRIGAIEKLDTSLYRINSEKINIKTVASEF